jgi:glucose-6-phosphate isomerase
VEQFLAGAHDMDGHFVETNPRHNLPVLLALTDVWNDSFLGSNGRIVTPFTEAFAAYPAFCATLEAQTCGNASSSMTSKSCSSSLVIDGGLHNAYDRALYQTGRVVPSELVMTMDSQISSNAASTIGLHGMDDVHATQDALICSMFAHADELAFGTDSSTSLGQPPPPIAASSTTTTPTLLDTTTYGNSNNHHTNETDDVSDGNRPSTLLMCGICDAFTCGQLVALAEHRAVVKARIWDVDPFAKEIGSSLRSKRTETLKDHLQNMFGQEEEEEENDAAAGAGDTNNEGINLSTKTILRHYANMLRDQRIYTVKG